MRILSALQHLVRTPQREDAAPPQPGAALLARMDQDLELGPVRARLAVPGAGAAALAVNARTLVGAERLAKGHPPLDGSWVGRGVMLAAAPAGAAAAVAWARACVDGRVAHVIDLSPEDGGPPLCMARPMPWKAPGGDTAAIARFEAGVAPAARHLKADPGYLVQAQAPNLGKSATERRIDVVLEEGAERRTQSLAWTRVPLEARQKVPAQLLLEVCRNVQSRAPEDGAAVAFLDRQGGDIAAAFAAACEMHREHGRSPLTPERLEDAVVQACGRMRLARSPDHFAGRPDLLASLAAFGELLIQEGVPSRTGGQGARDVERRRNQARGVSFGATVEKAGVDLQAPTERAVFFESRIETQFGDRPRLAPVPRGQRAALKARDPAWEAQPDDGLRVGGGSASDGSDIASSR